MPLSRQQNKTGTKKKTPTGRRKPIGLPKAPLIEQLSLRVYQRNSIARTRRYIAAFRSGATKGAALVHMATGAGKTRVIGALARCTPEIGGVLVLAPRVALCDQLDELINKRFSKSFKRKPKIIPKDVKRIEELISQGSVSDLTNIVIIATIQMVESMSRAGASQSGRQRFKKELYEHLKSKIDLVVVDEGHYEPALSWSRAVREFELPRVLFTATPYRNDLKRFEWNFQYTSHFTLREATEQAIIRNVDVRKRLPTRDPRKFIEDVLEFYDSEVKPKWPDARVIIRCDKRTSIDQMADVLLDKRRPFVAIHDTFKDTGGEDWERRSVPRRKDDESGDKWYGPEGPVFWVHQFKLLEGIDDQRFRLVAMFERLGNDRQVVQQIGRVIRNPDFPERGEAFVLDHSRGYHDRAWKALFLYDDDLVKLIRENPNRSPESVSSKPLQNEFVDRVLEAHPVRAYIDRKARTRFSFEDFRPLEDLSLPLAANLLQKGAKFDLEKLSLSVRRRLLEKDRVVRKPYKVDDTTRVLMYVAVNNVPFLGSSYFLSDAPGVIVICELSNLVAFYDSGGMSPLGLPGLGKAARPEYLRKLFSRRKGSNLVEIAAKNAQLGNRAVRTRSLSAASLDETVPGLEDHLQVLTRVTGYSVESAPPWDPRAEAEVRRRYLGFRHGRIVESGERVSLSDYRAWLDELEQIVTGDRRRLVTFSRYAADVEDVSDPVPRNVLVDVYEVIEAYKTIGNEEEGIQADQPLEIENLCQNVEKPGSDSRHLFWLKANGTECEVEIEWDPSRRRYELVSRDLDKMYVADRERGSLLSYLNREQSFRVLPGDQGVIYVDGEFYELMVPVGSRFDRDRYHVGKILEPLSRLRELKDEKGKNCLPDGSDWDPQSIFGFISRGVTGTNQIRPALRRPDIVVCDDMGTEVADFIVSEKDRVVFLHAKGIGRSSDSPAAYSAGKLTYVCGQAIKNIRYLSMFNKLKPKNLKQWDEDKPWSSQDTTGYVRSRILRKPRGLRGGDQIWGELQNRIGNPRTNREVWLVLGGILSKNRLEKELSKSTPEAVQAMTLLHGTLAAVGSIDAKLRVFCHD